MAKYNSNEIHAQILVSASDYCPILIFYHSQTSYHSSLHNVM